MEVSEALLYLQEQANPDTEVGLGTTPKEHMGDRVQVNLVVTGLGAHTLEEAFLDIEQIPQRPKPVQQSAPAALQHAHAVTHAQHIPSITSSDLDIPAFLRRQSRVVSG